MKIEAITKNPSQLLDAIKDAINNNDLKTWSIKKDTGGNEYFTHTGQWEDKALIKPEVMSGKLTFVLTGWNTKMPDEATKGYYTGRFTEALMVHFSNKFDHLETFAK